MKYYIIFSLLLIDFSTTGYSLSPNTFSESLGNRGLSINQDESHTFSARSAMFTNDKRPTSISKLRSKMEECMAILDELEAGHQNPESPGASPRNKKDKDIKTICDHIKDRYNRVCDAIKKNPKVLGVTLNAASTTIKAVISKKGGGTLATASTICGCIGAWCKAGVQMWKARNIDEQTPRADKEKLVKRDHHETWAHFFTPESQGYDYEGVDAPLILGAKY